MAGTDQRNRDLTHQRSVKRTSYASAQMSGSAVLEYLQARLAGAAFETLVLSHGECGSGLGHFSSHGNRHPHLSPKTTGRRWGVSSARSVLSERHTNPTASQGLPLALRHDSRDFGWDLASQSPPKQVLEYPKLGSQNGFDHHSQVMKWLPQRGFRMPRP